MAKTGLIAKITKGKNPKYIVGYALKKSHKPEIIGGNLLGQNTRELVEEFQKSLQLRPEILKPIFHVALSFGKGKDVTDALMRDITDDYLLRMGWDLEKSQFVIIRHNDTSHTHCHAIASRIQLDGELVAEPHQDYRVSQKICRDLEQKYGLELGSNEPRPVMTQQKDERSMMERTGVDSIKVQLQTQVAEAATLCSTISEFTKELERRGIGLLPNMSLTTDRVAGVSYRCGDFPMKGSALGKAFSWKGLQRYFNLDYDKKRDTPQLRATLARETFRSKSATDAAILHEHSRQEVAVATTTGLVDLTEQFERVAESLGSPNLKAGESGGKAERDNQSTQPAASNFSQLGAKFEQLAERLRGDQKGAPAEAAVPSTDRTVDPTRQRSKRDQSHHTETTRVSAQEVPLQVEPQPGDIHLQRDTGNVRSSGSHHRNNDLGVSDDYSTRDSVQDQWQSQQHRDSLAADRAAANRAAAEEVNATPSRSGEQRSNTAPSPQPQPEVIKAVRTRYRQLYLKYEKQVRSEVEFTDTFAIDIKVAQLALQDQERDSSQEAAGVLAQSTYVLSMQQQGATTDEVIQHIRQTLNYAKARLSLNDGQFQKAFEVGNVARYCLNKSATANRIHGDTYHLEREGDELIVKAHPDRRADSTGEKSEILRVREVRTKTGRKGLFLLHSELNEQDRQHFEGVRQQLNQAEAQRPTKRQLKTKQKPTPQKPQQLEL